MINRAAFARIGRRAVLRAGVGAAAAAAMPCGARTVVKPVRFGLTAAVVRENLRFYDRWGSWLESRVGRPVEFVQRRSYREVMEFLANGDLDVAWICSYAFVRVRAPEFLGLMAVPEWRTRPLYQCYVIASTDSPCRSFDDLQGRVFAFTDPDSNTGYLYPQALLGARGRQSADFFRLTFFTYSHVESVEAVAAGIADGAAVDSYVWEHLKQINPALVERTRVVETSPDFGFPPLVYRVGVDEGLRRAMTDALLTMDRDLQGRALLDELMIDRFALHAPDLYDGVRRLAETSQIAWSR